MGLRFVKPFKQFVFCFYNYFQTKLYGKNKIRKHNKQLILSLFLPELPDKYTSTRKRFCQIICFLNNLNYLQQQQVFSVADVLQKVFILN